MHLQSLSELCRQALDPRGLASREPVSVTRCFQLLRWLAVLHPVTPCLCILSLLGKFQAFTMDILRHKDIIDELVTSGHKIMATSSEEEKQSMKVSPSLKAGQGTPDE